MCKKILCALLIAAVGVGTFGGCTADSTGNDENKTEISTVSEMVSNESKYVDESKGYDSWNSFNVKFDGKDFTLPFAFSELESLGWEVDVDELYDENYLEEGFEVVLENSKYVDGATVYVNIKDGMVTALDVDNRFCDDVIPEYVLAGGITLRSSLEDVIAVYGATENINNLDTDYTYYNYYDDESRYLQLCISEEKGVEMIALVYDDEFDN